MTLCIMPEHTRGATEFVQARTALGVARLVKLAAEGTQVPSARRQAGCAAAAKTQISLLPLPASSTSGHEAEDCSAD